MKHLFILCAIATLAIMATLSITFAQASALSPQQFSKAGLSFEYPLDWKLADSSTDGVHYITVISSDGADQIAVIAQLGSVEQCDFQAAGKAISDALISRVARQLHAANPLQTKPLKTRVGGEEISGAEFRGTLNNRPVTSEVYSFRDSMHFVNLVYLRADGKTSGQDAWESVRKTINLEPPVFLASALPRAGTNPNVLTGRALKLGHPDYPPIAKQNGAWGTVRVNVTIDENGKVIAAHSISGHPLLRVASQDAARRSQFSPTTMCGEPVRVAGVINYNFFLTAKPYGSFN